MLKVEERAEEEDEEEDGGSASDEGGYPGVGVVEWGVWQRSGYPVWRFVTRRTFTPRQLGGDLRFSCAAEKLPSIEQKKKFENFPERIKIPDNRTVATVGGTVEIIELLIY